MNKKYINDLNNEVPENTIVINPMHPNMPFFENLDEVIISLKGESKRNWFNPHFYYCLPLVIGNQYGFAIKSLYDFTAIWNGGESLSDTKIEVNIGDDRHPRQQISSHFGSGIITVQNIFSIRTPPNINIITMQTPNHFIPHIFAMTGVVETDNLRRDFTFNLKITQVNRKISVKKGEILASFIPIKRYFIDNFELKHSNEIFDSETLYNENLDMQEFNRQRNSDDKNYVHLAGRKYFNGEHAFGENFVDHQKRIIKNNKK
jgi:hypothetical protein